MERADKLWHASSKSREPVPPAAPKAKSVPRRPTGAPSKGASAASGFKAGGVVLPPIGKSGNNLRPPDTGATTTVGGPTPRQEFSDRSSLAQDIGRSAASSAAPSPRNPGAGRNASRQHGAGVEITRMRQALAQQFGTVHKACANLMPNPKRITPADLVSAMRRIEFCSEDEARRIFQRLDVKLRGVLSAGEIAGEEAETSERPAAAPVLSEMMNLAQGNEDVIRRVTDLAGANAELKRQLSLQADEVISLEADSRKQRDLFLDYEQQMTAHMEKVRTEAQQDAEVKLQQAIVRAKKDAEEDCKKQIREAQEAQQEANQQIAALQEKCETLDKRGPRVDALEMELRLVRERLERETEGRRIAEDKTKESENNYSQLQAHMGKLQRDNDELHRKLEEQTELANFHKEVSGDLQGRMDDVALQAEMRVRKERGKKEAIQRLEHILPREILLKAMS